MLGHTKSLCNNIVYRNAEHIVLDVVNVETGALFYNARDGSKFLLLVYSALCKRTQWVSDMGWGVSPLTTLTAMYCTLLNSTLPVNIIAIPQEENNSNFALFMFLIIFFYAKCLLSVTFLELHDVEKAQLSQQVLLWNAA